MTFEVYISIKDGSLQYYLLKVVKRNFDVYCIPPNLGIHYTLHESGQSHFRYEAKPGDSVEQLPVALLMGEAGTLSDNNIVVSSIKDTGRALNICNVIFSIKELYNDFQKFDRKVSECFVIDKALFPSDTDSIMVGVWAVPERNKASFEFNNRDIDGALLYKVAHCDPQIWILARSL
jgi:hypothetical protein